MKSTTLTADVMRTIQTGSSDLPVVCVAPGPGFSASKKSMEGPPPALNINNII